MGKLNNSRPCCSNLITRTKNCLKKYAELRRMRKCRRCRPRGTLMTNNNNIRIKTKINASRTASSQTKAKNRSQPRKKSVVGLTPSLLKWRRWFKFMNPHFRIVDMHVNNKKSLTLHPLSRWFN
jgi:hypothetical protein